MSTTTALVAARAGQARVSRAKSVVASAKPVVKATKRVSKAVPVGLAATAPLLASMPAHAQNALFTVADLADGNVDEETALYVLIGGSLAICTAVLSLVIGSDQFIKNFSKK